MVVLDRLHYLLCYVLIVHFHNVRIQGQKYWKGKLEGIGYETSFAKMIIKAYVHISCSTYSMPRSSLQERLKVIKSGSEAELKP
jgi:hypothetical protein